MRVYGIDIVPNAHCKKGVLCDYEIIWETSEAYKERCLACGREIVYKKGHKENIDNKKYADEHIRHFIQPTGKTAKLFAMAYGEDKDAWNKPIKYRGKKAVLEEFDQTISDAKRKVAKWQTFY